MVQRIPDPIKILPITYSQEELQEFADLIQAEQLPADFLDRYYDAVDAAVQGADAPINPKTGKRIGIGIGSPLNQSQNSINAYKKFCSDEPDFQRHLARMEKELAETNARKAAEAAAKGKSKTGWLGR
jgi:hypothetical protein